MAQPILGITSTCPGTKVAPMSFADPISARVTLGSRSGADADAIDQSVSPGFTTYVRAPTRLVDGVP